MTSLQLVKCNMHLHNTDISSNTGASLAKGFTNS
uniref:Uncharacterized protein n=1 Tax=Arundo donax TaxID=35708 RepID=A0A0A8XV27_ARUDO